MTKRVTAETVSATSLASSVQANYPCLKFLFKGIIICHFGSKENCLMISEVRHTKLLEAHHAYSYRNRILFMLEADI